MKLELSHEQTMALLNVLGSYVEDAEIAEEGECPCPDLPYLRIVLEKVEEYVANLAG